MKGLAQRLPRNTGSFSGDRLFSEGKENILFYLFNMHLKKWTVLLDLDISRWRSLPHLP